MQTFLTHYNENIELAFRRTASDLDWQRLGKQRVEAYQILRAIMGFSKGWTNHPCTKMWRDNYVLLELYHDVMIDEWVTRGYRNTMKKYYGHWKQWPAAPEWFTPELVVSHQSNLIRKKPEHYLPLWPNVPDDLPYLWPVQ
jgi:hypothetical protein